MYSQDTLQVTLSWALAGIGHHHAGHRGIGTEQRFKLGGGFELCRQDRLEHCQQEMFFPTFVLISIEGEHDGLEVGIDF